MELGADKFEVYLFLADERGDCTYATEHRFLERPDVETVKVLFDEAKREFAIVYGDEVTPEDFSVRVTYVEDPAGE